MLCDFNSDSIDFVMIWVDDQDEEWKKTKESYASVDIMTSDNRSARYRDWGLLKYWFRAVEKNAPWVNKVFFITCGHKPEWLNINAPKLRFVSHKDYIPNEYLPTFSSHPIELNINRIEDLSNKIVYFNDDMFVLRPVEPSLFYDGNTPKHPAIIHAIAPRNNGVTSHVFINCLQAINRHFEISEVLHNNYSKWFSIRKNGFGAVIENLWGSQYKEFIGFRNEHLPVPILKSTMDTVWNEENSIMHETSLHKFRDIRDVSQYVFRYWQIVSGNFTPVKAKVLGREFVIEDKTDTICCAIRNQSYNLICLNDEGLLSSDNTFEKAKIQIQQAFESVFPDKSSFEK